MDVSTKCQNRNLEIYLKGELDHHGAKGFLGDMEKSIEQNLPIRLILDFSGVTFMDSSGIAVVLRGWQKMKTMEGTVILRNVGSQPKKVFAATNIKSLVTME